MEKNLSQKDALEKLKDLVDEIKVCMFITNDHGSDHTRPMATIETEESGTLWFFTNVNSGKISEIQDDSQVHLVYAHPGKESYLDLWGTARIIKDKQQLKDKWTPIVKAWFPEGVDDPSLCLLKVTPQDAYYWDSETGKMLSFLKIAASAITGSGNDGGAEGRLDV